MFTIYTASFDGIAKYSIGKSDGSYWSPKDKKWTFPATNCWVRNLNRLLKQFHDEFKLENYRYDFQTLNF